MSKCEDVFGNYQIFRTLSYIDLVKDDLFIIVYPEGNKKLQEQLKDVKENCLTSNYKANFKSCTWETLIQGLYLMFEFAPPSPKIQTTISMFKEKYLDYQKA